MEVMVGMAMMASMMEALSTLSPVGMSHHCCISGAMTTMPTKPSTTEGRLASSSTAGLRISLVRWPATSPRYRAAPTPRGTAMAEEMTVTATDPAIRGRMPKSGGS